ncbi:MAG: hypothetical protein LBK03_00605, partial [Bacteroidales bacterium]|nr:hypothetical protein [Bacteroidales bacterium]
THLRPSLNQLFAMESLAGFEAIIEQIKAENMPVLMAGLQMDEQLKLLYGTKLDNLQFRKLLQTLQIDNRNYEKWQESCIYSYATHLKKFNFTFFHNALILSDDIEVVKAAVNQFRNPINLLANKEFRNLYQLVDKNRRQNWLLLQHSRFASILSTQSDSIWQPALHQLNKTAQWSAFQLRMNDNEMHLSGYCSAESPFFQHYKTHPATTEDLSDRLPMDCYHYTAYFAPQTSIFTDSDFYQNIWQKLCPEALYTFTLSNSDSITCYTLLKTDTTQNPISKIISDTMPDMFYYKNHPVYKTSCTAITKEGKQLTFYMTIYKDSYIFAESPDALKQYLNRIIANKTLSNSNFHKYVHNHLPSERCFEFSGQNIACTQLLTLAFANPNHNFIPITIYARF